MNDGAIVVRVASMAAGATIRLHGLDVVDYNCYDSVVAGCVGTVRSLGCGNDPPSKAED